MLINALLEVNRVHKDDPVERREARAAAYLYYAIVAEHGDKAYWKGKEEKTYLS